jgi:hypothetical protein
VVEICAALALGGSLLRHLGLNAEAGRLEALFGSVEWRLAPDQPDESDDSWDSDDSLTAPSPPSWS